MLACKKCASQEFVKNGIVLGKQRYQSKTCNATFREGDNRTNEKIIAKKALCILLYAMAKGSFRMLGRILNVHYTKWFTDGYANSQNHIQNRPFQKTSRKWSSMKCGTLSVKKKQTLAPQGD